MKSLYAFILVGLLFIGAPVWAAPQQGHISLQTVGTQIKVTVGKDGKQERQLEPANHVLPGTEVIWTINYKIVGGQPVTNAEITDPIPAHMVYVADSASGADTDISFSVDGGKTWGKAGELQIKSADGTTTTALPKDYTNIRWIVRGRLAPGAKGSVSYHAILQ